MTFQALSAFWGWTLVAAAVAVAAALFFLRPRPPREVVSSLIVWDALLGASGDRERRERVRLLISRVMTCFIAGAMALAIARPVFGTSPRIVRRLLVLDSSWSMAARTSTGETRWQRAVAAATAMVERRDGPVALATTMDGVVQGFTTEDALLARALARLEPGGGGSQIPRPIDADEVHLFTDGATPLAPLAEDVVHSVFEPADNVAIVAFDVKVQGPARAAEVYLAIVNDASRAQTCRVTMTRGTAVVWQEEWPLESGQTKGRALPIDLAGDPRLHLRVDAPSDALDVDDEAGAWLWQSEPLQVGVIGPDAGLVEALSAEPGVRVQVVAPANFASTDVDVWVLNQWKPDAVPDRPALLIDPPSGGWVGAASPAEVSPTWPSTIGGGLTAGVDPTSVRLGPAHGLGWAALDSRVVSMRGTPLVSEADTPAGPVLVWHFSLASSNLSDSSAFPVLIGNAIDALGRPWAGVRQMPGRIALPAGTTRVVRANGTYVPLTRAAERVSADLRRPGLYRVTAGRRSTVVSVGQDAGAQGVGLRRTTLLPSAQTGGRPAWTWAWAWWSVLAAIALVFVTIEWVTWQRRVTT